MEDGYRSFCLCRPGLVSPQKNGFRFHPFDDADSLVVFFEISIGPIQKTGQPRGTHGREIRPQLRGFGGGRSAHGFSALQEQLQALAAIFGSRRKLFDALIRVRKICFLTDFL